MCQIDDQEDMQKSSGSRFYWWHHSKCLSSEKRTVSATGRAVPGSTCNEQFVEPYSALFLLQDCRPNGKSYRVEGLSKDQSRTEIWAIAVKIVLVTDQNSPFFSLSLPLSEVKLLGRLRWPTNHLDIVALEGREYRLSTGMIPPTGLLRTRTAQ